MGSIYDEKRQHGSLITFNNDNDGNHNRNHYTTNNRISHNSNRNMSNMIETTGELIVVDPAADNNRVMSTLEIDVVPEQQHDHVYTPPPSSQQNNNTDDTYMEEKTAELLYVNFLSFVLVDKFEKSTR